MVLIAASASAQASSSASVVNSVPAFNSIRTYDSYVSSTNNSPQSAFTFDCASSSASVQIQINATDLNGYTDITDNGSIQYKIVLLDTGVESTFARFGDNLVSATYETGAGTEVIYTASFAMQRSDPQQISPDYYRVHARVYDGADYTNSTSETANFTFSSSICTGGGGSGNSGSGATEEVTVTSREGCIEEWSCGGWSDCADSIQSRFCVELNGCGTQKRKPALDQSCIMPEVVPDEPLFDILVEIPDTYKVLSAGDQILTSIKLVNIGSAGRIDVYLDYEITDRQGNVVLKKRETVAVETQASFVRTFDLPENLPPGNYHLSARLTYFDGRFAESEHSFTIVEPVKSSAFQKKISYVILGIAGLGLILFLFAKKAVPYMEQRRIAARVRKMVKKRQK